MTTEELRGAVEGLYRSGGDVVQILQVVRRFRDEGGQQGDAYREFQALVGQLQSEQPADECDLLRDVMDYIAGYCSPGARIWR